MDTIQALTPAAKAFNQEGSVRMFQAYASLEENMCLFQQAEQILTRLPNKDRQQLEKAFNRLNQFAPGLSYKQATILCRLGMQAARQAAWLEPVA